MEAATSDISHWSLSAKKERGNGTHLPELLGVERRAEEEGLDLGSELPEVLSKRRQGLGCKYGDAEGQSITPLWRRLRERSSDCERTLTLSLVLATSEISSSPPWYLASALFFLGVVRWLASLSRSAVLTLQGSSSSVMRKIRRVPVFRFLEAREREGGQRVSRRVRR